MSIKYFFSRQWIVVTAKEYRSQEGTTNFHLITIKTRVENEKLILSAEGLPDIAVPASSTEYDEKDLIPLK